MSNYEKLRNAVGMKCEIQDFNEVNKCINDILPNEYEDNKIKVDIIKSLISHFEGKLNKANFYTITSISFALITCAISVLGIILDIDKEIHLVAILCFYAVGIALYVTFYSIKVKKSDYKDTFILKALNFKLDELIEESKRTEEESVSDKIKETKGKKKSKKSSHRK